MKTLNLREAASFLHMHPEELRNRAKPGLIPGAKVARRWVFIEDDLAEFVRSQYPVKRQALAVAKPVPENTDRSAGATSSRQTMREYDELLGLNSRRTQKLKS
jgi:hypothetical protein